MLKWLENWYAQNCDEEWEHEYGLKIETLDNPGWHICIDLSGTTLQDLELDPFFYEKNDNDWYSWEIKDNQFLGFGDTTKLEFLITVFKDLVLKHSLNTKFMN